MADISSSIRIEDGFTEPLRNLAKAAWDVESGVTAVAKSLVEQEKEFDSISERARSVGKEFSVALGERLIGNIDMVLPAIKSVGVATSEMAKTSIKAVTEFADLSHGLGVNLAKDITAASFIHPARLYASSMKELGSATKKYASAGFWGALATMRWNMINKVSMAAFHKMKDSYIKGFNALMESIGKSIDEINIGDKLSAQFGEAGDVAKKRAYELANELGESATMVSELAMKAGQEGIGTEHFERMMKLADKVGKLRQGETTESAANTLMSNIKSGHDASSIAQLYGGGQMMERQLRSAGYERALNRGDLDKALEIAEQIAEQAGLTDENYNKATNNLSQNYKKIMNTIDNVKKRLAETFNRTFAPTIEKIKKLLESNTFKTVVNVADWLMEKLGKFLNWFTESAVDNIHIIGVLLGVGIVSKIMFLLPKLKMIIVLAQKLRGPIGWIVRGLTKVVGKLVSIIAKQGIIALKAKAIAALKMAGPWLAIGAAIGGITYGIYKLEGTSESFLDWIKRKLTEMLKNLFASVKMLINIGKNVITFFENIFVYIKEMPSLFAAALKDMENSAKGFWDEVTGKVNNNPYDPSKRDKRIYITSEEFRNLPRSERKKYHEAWDEEGGSPLDNFNLLMFDPFHGSSGYTGRYFKIDEEGKEEEKSEVEKLLEKINKDNNINYVDITSGADEFFETAVGWLEKLFKQGEEQTKEQEGIADDTTKIRQLGEQEEELKWLKAFSDRQIMSAYNSQTTNNRTINMNGVSQNTMAEAYRRNRSTIPARAAM